MPQDDPYAAYRQRYSSATTSDPYAAYRAQYAPEAAPLVVSEGPDTGPLMGPPSPTRQRLTPEQEIALLRGTPRPPVPGGTVSGFLEGVGEAVENLPRALAAPVAAYYGLFRTPTPPPRPVPSTPEEEVRSVMPRPRQATPPTDFRPVTQLATFPFDMGYEVATRLQDPSLSTEDKARALGNFFGNMAFLYVTHKAGVERASNRADYRATAAADEAIRAPMAAERAVADARFEQRGMELDARVAERARVAQQANEIGGTPTPPPQPRIDLRRQQLGVLGGLINRVRDAKVADANVDVGPMIRDFLAQQEAKRALADNALMGGTPEMMAANLADRAAKFQKMLEPETARLRAIVERRAFEANRDRSPNTQAVADFQGEVGAAATRVRTAKQAATALERLEQERAARLAEAEANRDAIRDAARAHQSAVMEAQVARIAEPPAPSAPFGNQPGAVSLPVMTAVAGGTVGAAAGALSDKEHPVWGAVRYGLAGMVGAGVLGVLGGKGALRSRGNLPQDVFARKIKLTADVGDFELSIREARVDMRRAARVVYGRFKAIPEADQTLMGEVLKGERPLVDAPEPFQPILRRMRNDIDVATRRGLTEGAFGELGGIPGRKGAPGPRPTTADIAQGNIGSYLNRSYRIYDDPTWVQRIPEAVRQRVWNLLRDEMPDASRNAIDGYLEMLLDKNVDGPLAILAESKLGAKGLSILRRRGDIAPEIREMWGEYTDPLVQYSRSMQKMARLVANHSFLTDVAREGAGRIFHPEPVVINGQNFIREIAPEGSRAMGPLSGLFTTPEIAAAFERQFSTPNMEWYGRLYMAANGTVSLSKTVLSPVTQLRNLTGNTLLQLANGNINPLYAPKAIRATIQGLTSGPDMVWRTYYRRLQRLGVVGESANAGELRAILRDMGVGQDRLSGSKVARGAAEVSTAAQHLYRAGDDVWKVFAFESEMTKYRAVLPNMPLAMLEERVAGIVRNTMPTYSLVPEAIQGLRRMPLVGQFVSWPAEIYRTLYHTIKLTREELMTPELRGIGARRLAGLVAAAGIVPGVVAGARALVGTSRQDEDDLRRHVPDYQRNSNMVHLSRGKGVFSFLDISYTDPYAAIRDPVMALVRGEIGQAVEESLRPFMSEKILTTALLDVSRNTTARGGRVVNPEADPFKRDMGRIGHLGRAIEPGALTTVKRIVRGFQGVVRPSGRAYSAPEELAAMVTGLRPTRIDVRESLSGKTRAYIGRMREANDLLIRVVNSRGTVSDNDIKSAYEEADQSRRRIFEEFSEDVQSVRRLGVDDGQVRNILRANGLGGLEARSVYEGEYLPYRPGSTFMRSWSLRQGVVVPENMDKATEEAIRRRGLLSEPSPAGMRTLPPRQ